MTDAALARRWAALKYEYHMARKHHRRSAKIYNIFKKLTTERLKRECGK